MAKSNAKLSEKETKFLICLLDNGNLSDVAIAKKIGASKATCSRIRKKLEKDLISEYIPVVDLDKVGVNVFLVLLFKWNAFHNEELTKKTFKAFDEDPHVIFLANGQGSGGLSTVLFMGFTSLEEYNAYLNEFRKRYDPYVEGLTHLILPSKEIVKHDFTEIIKKVLKGG